MSDKYPQIVATQGEWYLGGGIGRRVVYGRVREAEDSIYT